MKELPLPSLARQHCAAEGNRLNVKGYIADRYQVGHRFFSEVAAGQKKPSAKLLATLSQAHVRLFPTEPVLLLIPNFPTLLLGSHPSLNS